MKKKTYLGLVNAAGMGFAVQTGQEVELDADTAEDLMRAAYVWPMKKGLTLDEAQRLAGEHRAEILAAQEVADPAADPDADPADDPDADPAADSDADPDAEPAADPDADPDAEPAADPDAETQNDTPAE